MPALRVQIAQVSTEHWVEMVADRSLGCKHLLAKIGLYTAENEFSEIEKNFGDGWLVGWFTK